MGALYNPLDEIDKTAVTGILKGDGAAISAAVSGTDIKTVNGASLLGAGNILAGSSFVLLTGTRNHTAASGDVSYTGAGGTPKAVIALADDYSGGYAVSVGFAVGAGAANNGCLLQNDAATDYWGHSAFLINASRVDGSQTAILKTFDANGFTLTWAKTGTPAGLSYLQFLVIV